MTPFAAADARNVESQGRGASGACASAASASRSPPRRRTSHGAKALATVTVAAVTAAATSPSASAADARKMPTEARAGGVTTINRSGLGTFAYTAPAHAPCKRGRRKPRRSSSSGGGDDGGDGNWGNGGDGGNNNWGDGNGENEFSNASVFFDALSLLALSGSLSHVVVRPVS